jgi:hypothetical protein
MDARIIGDMAVTSHRYLEAPNAPRYLLQCACQAAIDTSAQAARALDDLAIERDAPSKPVALLRAPVPAESPDRALQAPPDTLAMALRAATRSSAANLSKHQPTREPLPPPPDRPGRHRLDRPPPRLPHRRRPAPPRGRARTPS